MKQFQSNILEKLQGKPSKETAVPQSEIRVEEELEDDQRLYQRQSTQRRFIYQRMVQVKEAEG